jgi:hypothetical protein
MPHQRIDHLSCHSHRFYRSHRRGVPNVSDGVVLRVGGVPVIGVGSPDRFLLQRRQVIG